MCDRWEVPDETVQNLPTSPAKSESFWATQPSIDRCDDSSRWHRAYAYSVVRFGLRVGRIGADDAFKPNGILGDFLG